MSNYLSKYNIQVFNLVERTPVLYDEAQKTIDRYGNYHGARKIVRTYLGKELIEGIER